MAIATVQSYASIGIEATPVQVEVHISNGLPRLSIVGMPEIAVRESKERVRSAIINSKFKFPSAFRITINLAPADLPKIGGRFDLPIAVGILAASRQLDPSALDEYAFVGELALSGQLRRVKGLLPVSLRCKRDRLQMIIPQQGYMNDQLRYSQYDKILTASNLLQVCNHLSHGEVLPRIEYGTLSESAPSVDFEEVKGQPKARRALEVAASGRHNLLMVGPPGTGKSMLAERLPSILPPLHQEQALEVAALYSVADIYRKHFYLPPTRAPHHSSSAIAIVGGGSRPLPGEISLAHLGVLFLDELPEYPRNVLESLREPMESGTVVISRSTMKVRYPCNFQFIAAMNPCPCGFLGDKSKQCQCAPHAINRYRNRVSGPLLDRIDLHIQVHRPDTFNLFSSQVEESSATMRARVIAAHNRQIHRQGCANADLKGKALERYILLNDQQKEFIHKAMQQFNLSPRALHRIMRVARTIADLQGEDSIQQGHLVEALSFRQLSS